MENYKTYTFFLLISLSKLLCLFAAEEYKISPAQLRTRFGKIQITSTKRLTLEEETWKKQLEQQKINASSTYNVSMINSFLHRVLTIQGLSLEDEKQNLEQLLKQ